MLEKHEPPLPGNSIPELRKLEEQGRLQTDQIVVAATEDCIDKLGIDLLEAAGELHQNLVANLRKGDSPADANDRAIPESPETLLLKNTTGTQQRVIIQDWIRQCAARQKER